MLLYKFAYFLMQICSSPVFTRNQIQGRYPGKPRVRAPVHNGSDDISGVLEILNDFHRLISALTISLL